MKYTVRIMAVVLGLVLAQSFALADAPSPKERPENPNIVAGRTALDAKDYKTAVGHLSRWNTISARSSSTPTTVALTNIWASSIST